MHLISRIKFYIILLSVFLIPVVFNPFSADVFYSIKGILIIFFATLIFLMYGIESLILKKIIFKISWINICILILFLITFVSTVANTSFISSLLGQGTTTSLSDSIFGVASKLNNGFLVVTALTLYYFIVSTSIDTNNKKNLVMRALIYSALAIVIISFLRYVPGLDFGVNSPIEFIIKGFTDTVSVIPDIKSPQSFYPIQNFSPIGPYYYIPLFLLVCTLFQMYILKFNMYFSENKRKKSIVQFLDYFILFLLVFFFVITTWSNVSNILFGVLGIISVMLLIYLGRKQSVISKIAKNVKNSDSKFSLLSIVIIISSFLGIICSLITDKLKQVTAPILPLEAAWRVTFATLGNSFKNGLFGLGPETYPIQYLSSRPDSLNSSNLVFENIVSSNNYILELISTYGLIGLCGFAFISIKILNYFWKNKNTTDPYLQTLIISLGVFFISLFLIPLNITMLFVLILLFILLSCENLDKNNTKNFVVSLSGGNTNVFSFASRGVSNKNSENNIAPQAIFIISSVVFLFSTIFLINLFISHVYNYISLKNQLSSSDTTSVTSSLNMSQNALYHFGNTDYYYNRYAALTYQKFLNLISDISSRSSQSANQANKSTTVTADEQSQIDSLTDQVIKSVDKAIELNPLHYDNYYLKANVFYTFSKISDTDAIKQKNIQVAEDSALKALVLNPQSQNLYLIYGQIELLKGDSASAISYYQNGINKYPYNIAAYTALAEVYREGKDYTSAINELKIAENILVPNSDYYKQIFSAIDSLTTEQKTYTDSQKTITSTPTITPNPTPVPTTSVKKK